MKILITGGAGFIGSNLAAKLIEEHEVTVFDSLERVGSGENKRWLEQYPLEFVEGGITDAGLVKELVKDAEVVLHLAAQVAVTTSVKEPRKDFEVNARGTFNVVEAARMSGNNPLVVFSSTNKVYGKIGEVGPAGVSEQQPLDFYSPYGCSKGAGDSYVKDYGRIYGLPTVVLRKSCVYGGHQHGTEDQGWVAHFVKQALEGELITIYGDGSQVRDLLFIGDLVELYGSIIDEFQEAGDEFAGSVFNIGGGLKNAVSLLELVEMLERKLEKKVEREFDVWRPGDQRVYISDISKIKARFGWEPKIGVEEGLEHLILWMRRK